MSEDYEFLDTAHHDKLLDALTQVSERWQDYRIKAENEGRRAEAIVLTYFEKFAHDLLVAFENMIEDDNDDKSIEVTKEQ